MAAQVVTVELVELAAVAARQRKRFRAAATFLRMLSSMAAMVAAALVEARLVLARHPAWILPRMHRPQKHSVLAFTSKHTAATGDQRPDAAAAAARSAAPAAMAVTRRRASSARKTCRNSAGGILLPADRAVILQGRILLETAETQ
jgi:hypothetical protein